LLSNWTAVKLCRCSMPHTNTDSSSSYQHHVAILALKLRIFCDVQNCLQFNVWSFESERNFRLWGEKCVRYHRRSSFSASPKKSSLILLAQITVGIECLRWLR